MTPIQLQKELQKLGYGLLYNGDEFKTQWNKYFNRPDIKFYYLNVEFGCWIEVGSDEHDTNFWEIEDLEDALDFFVNILEQKGLTKHIPDYTIYKSKILGC